MVQRRLDVAHPLSRPAPTVADLLTGSRRSADLTNATSTLSLAP